MSGGSLQKRLLLGSFLRSATAIAAKMGAKKPSVAGNSVWLDFHSEEEERSGGG